MPPAIIPLRCPYRALDKRYYAPPVAQQEPGKCDVGDRGTLSYAPFALRPPCRKLFSHAKIFGQFASSRRQCPRT